MLASFSSMVRAQLSVVSFKESEVIFELEDSVSVGKEVLWSDHLVGYLATWFSC